MRHAILASLVGLALLTPAATAARSHTASYPGDLDACPASWLAFTEACFVIQPGESLVRLEVHDVTGTDCGKYAFRLAHGGWTHSELFCNDWPPIEIPTGATHLIASGGYGCIVWGSALKPEVWCSVGAAGTITATFG